MASLSPRAYTLVKARYPQLVLLARERVGGAPTYQSFIVAREDLGIEKLGDLKGKRMCFVDPASASGYVYPRAMLRAGGVEPDHDFKSVHYGGTHPGVARALAQGKCDGGAIASTVLTQWQTGSGLDGKPSALKVLAVSVGIPGDAIVMRHDLDPKLARAIQAGFKDIIELSQRGKQPKELKSGGYMPASDEDYNPVRKMAEKAR